jgi:hypothetical protein
MIPDSAALDKALLIALPIGEAIVLGFLLRSKTWKTFPVFCLYIFWGFLSDAALFDILTWQSAEVYQKFYTFQIIVDSFMLFSVLVELAWSVLRPIRASLPKATILVLIVLVALAGLAIWPLAAQAPAQMDKASRYLFHLQETFAILRVVCFAVMAGLSQVLSIGWRDRELQIASGFGVYAIVSLLVMLLHARSTQVTGDPYHYLDQAVSISYLGTLSYWVLSFSAKEQKRKEFSPQMQHLLLQLGGGARAGRIALGDLPSTRTRKKD